jgi:dTDP-4-amino-4,6-dideoxygalactose transaminase
MQQMKCCVQVFSWAATILLSLKTGWPRKNHVSYAVTCHSGTQALEIIAGFYRDQDLAFVNPPTVIVPALTYPATANAFLRAGWSVIIGDTDYYGQIDVRKMINDLDTHYHAVCAVGLYGAALRDMRPVESRALLIEDAAQHWLSDGCKRQGGAAAISFDPTKNFANYGNGGAIVSDDRNLLDYARNWVNNGKHTRHAETGSNSRMSETDCAQMMIKTRYIDAWQKRRAEIANHWIERLKNTGIRTLIDDTNFSTHCYHKFVIEVDPEILCNVILPYARLKPRYTMLSLCTNYQHIEILLVLIC